MTAIPDTFRPRANAEVEDTVRWALDKGRALEVVGHGSKRLVGRPPRSDATLDLSALRGVTLYEPDELVLSAKAGTPLAEIETLIAAQNQHLAFEPMDCGPLLGGMTARGTIGGALATNLSGPRRIIAGAARDHVLGFTAVSGRGETFKSGGRVVKNVTGYDLGKLMAGSWGTLAVMTDVTVKVLPRPEALSTVLVVGLDDAAAIRAMSAAMALPCDISGAAHLPATVAARTALSGILASGRAVTALRIDGVAPSVVQRRDALLTAMKEHGDVRVCDDIISRTFWRAVRDVTPFGAVRTGVEQPLWRLSTAPANGAELTRLIVAEAGPVEVLYDWAGGLVWLLLEPSDDAGAALVHRALARCGGQAMLFRAPAAVRAQVDVFGRQAASLAALTQRVKTSFDPEGVLNPRRMWGGF
jgi:glycolate oxidase FAD binding subunit